MKNNKNESKEMALDLGTLKHVTDVIHISIAGFTLNRNPMAAVHEIIRQGKKSSHVCPFQWTRT